MGILVAEEAEKRGIPFVIATCLEHREEPLPIDVAFRRDRVLVPGFIYTVAGDRHSFKFWERAYQKLERRHG